MPIRRGYRTGDLKLPPGLYIQLEITRHPPPSYLRNRISSFEHFLGPFILRSGVECGPVPETTGQHRTFT